MTTPEAATALGVTIARVQQLIKAGRLPATKHGRDWYIQPAHLALVAERKPGRPRKGHQTVPSVNSSNSPR